MSDYYGILNELNYGGIMRKQASVDKLFPGRFRKRVRDLASVGGVTLVEQMPETWHFKVPSSNIKDNGIKYDVYVRFRNLEEVIKKLAGDRRLWNKDKTNIDLRFLSAEILNKVDIETDCACPADLYWGPEYIKTQRTAQYDHEENRPPDIRNPHQYGALCKHGELVFEVLPMYTGTFSKFLERYWMDVIEKTVKASTKDMSQFRAAAEELGRREREQKEKSRERPPEKKEIPPTKHGKEEEEEVPTAEPGEEGELPTAEPVGGAELGQKQKKGSKVKPKKQEGSLKRYPKMPGTEPEPEKPLRRHSKLPELEPEKPLGRYSKLPEEPESMGPLKRYPKMAGSPTKPATKPLGFGNKLATKPTLKRGTK